MRSRPGGGINGVVAFRVEAIGVSTLDDDGTDEAEDTAVSSAVIAPISASTLPLSVSIPAVERSCSYDPAGFAGDSATAANGRGAEPGVLGSAPAGGVIGSGTLPSRPLPMAPASPSGLGGTSPGDMGADAAPCDRHTACHQRTASRGNRCRGNAAKGRERTSCSTLTPMATPPGATNPVANPPGAVSTVPVPASRGAKPAQAYSKSVLKKCAQKVFSSALKRTQAYSRVLTRAKRLLVSPWVWGTIQMHYAAY